MIKKPKKTISKAKVEEKPKVEDKKVEEPKPQGPSIEEQVEDDARAMKKQLDAQPKVNFLIPLASGENEGSEDQVCINGYKMKIPKGKMVEIPQQVAELLAEKYKVQMLAGRDKLLSRSAQVQEALNK